MLAQNSDPFTYFGGRPVRVARDVAIDDGTLAISVLRRARQRDMGFIIGRLFSDRFKATDHRHIDHVARVTEGRIESLSDDPDGKRRSFPVQVDGDYIGDFAELDLSVEPAANRRRLMATTECRQCAPLRVRHCRVRPRIMAQADCLLPHRRWRGIGAHRLRGRRLDRVPRQTTSVPRATRC